ncbi:ATP-binding protein [Patescibacteria group bacterium]
MIIGHQRILNFFEKSINNNRLSHAYLFFGPESVGKQKIAIELIKMLNGQESYSAVHPDVLIIKPEILENNKIKKESEIGIGQARKIQRQMSLSPYSAPYKIALIDNAEKMTSEASNCLLKTLEEPTGNSVLILITSNFNSLLPTICSRCQLIKFLPVPNEEIKNGLNSVLDDNIVEKIVQLSNGRPGVAVKYLENPKMIDDKDKAIDQLEKLIGADLNDRYKFVEKISKDIVQAKYNLGCWMFWFRDLILAKVGCPELAVYSRAAQYNNNYSLAKLRRIIQAIKKTSEILNNSSFNSRLALEVLMLEL